MAIVSGVTTLVVTQTTGSRTFVATAATQDTAAGSSVVVTITNTPTGLGPSAQPDSLTLRYVDDAGNTIRTVALNTAAASQTDTFFFTATGITGGSARAGTVEMKLQATNTTGSLGTTYDIETDGAPNTTPTGGSSTLDRGWIRGTTTATVALSNIALGGAKTTPAAFRESIFARVTGAAPGYVTRTVTLTLTGGTHSAITTAASTSVFDATFTSAVDKRFPASALTAGLTVSAVANATLTGLPAWTFTTTTADTLDVDPRLTCAHILQINANTFATPPFSSTTQSANRETTAIGFTDTHFRDSRGTRTGNVMSRGVNGLDFHVVLVDAATLGTPATRDALTATQGGEAGWGTGFMPWTATLPGGAWTKTVTLNAAVTDLTSAYLLTPTASYELNAPRSSVAVIVGGGPTLTAEHFTPGATFQAGCSVLDTETGKRLVATTPTVSLVRLADATLGAAAGFAQYLDASNTWVTLSQAAGAGDTSVLYQHTLTESRAGSGVYVKNFNAASGFDTSGWGTYDIFVIVRVVVGGTPYAARIQSSVLGSPNSHAGYALDPIGLATAGILSQR